MKQYISLLLFTFLAVCIKAQPPNNSIFMGGPGDGTSNSAWLIASTNIFAGGHGDGFSNSANPTPANSIYLGGAGDGESYAANVSIPNPIYSGGEGDGFSFNTNNALPNNIFLGGGGDGWHAVVLPLGPLPVELINFTAQHFGSGHLIKWRSASEINTMHYELERSQNGRNFEVVTITSAQGSNTSGADYSFRVEEPFNGNNFYRLKMVDIDRSFTYSNIALLVNSLETNWSVYPNPTAEVLYISFPESSDEDNFPAAIFDAAGKLLKRFSIKASQKNAVDVAVLPAGVYYLRFVIKNQPMFIRFVKSN